MSMNNNKKSLKNNVTLSDSQVTSTPTPSPSAKKATPTPSAQGAENKQQSFFAQFTVEEIFKHWNTSDTLLQIAQKLGFNNEKGLARVDYEYIESIKNRGTWHNLVVSVDRRKERERAKYVKNLSAEELKSAMNCDGIQKVSHLALHFLLSPKHGREKVRARVLELNLEVKDALHKGIFGVTKEPQQWPTRYYEARQGKKPMVCPVCGFKATSPQQIQLHHPDNIDYGPKKNRNPTYYKTPVSPICANCHSIEHRTGEKLKLMCGQWHRAFPRNLKYKDPSEIFTEDCPETYRLQKEYYLKWILTGPDQYKCQRCGVDHWVAKQNKPLLSLEIHHKDGNSHNSSLNNLELLCPNCKAVLQKS
jgi:hypothetical protein